MAKTPEERLVRDAVRGEVRRASLNWLLMLGLYALAIAMMALAGPIVEAIL